MRMSLVAIFGAAAATVAGAMAWASLDAPGKPGGPIIFVGDSITEYASLPRSICGHRIINAGISGSYARQYADFAKAARRLDPNWRPALFVVAIGVNDGHRQLSDGNFARDYARLLDALAATGARLALASLAPIEQERPNIAATYIPARWSEIDAAIRATAATRHLPLADLSGVRGTVDGVHLNEEGYKLWLSSLISAARQAICPDWRAAS